MLNIRKHQGRWLFNEWGVFRYIVSWNNLLRDWTSITQWERLEYFYKRTTSVVDELTFAETKCCKYTLDRLIGNYIYFNVWYKLVTGILSVRGGKFPMKLITCRTIYLSLVVTYVNKIKILLVGRNEKGWGSAHNEKSTGLSPAQYPRINEKECLKGNRAF